jgi:hypothetical protein
MPKTGLIAGFLALTLAAACVPAADPAAKSSSFLPDSGLPADAVVKLLFIPDVASYPDLFILTARRRLLLHQPICVAPYANGWFFKSSWPRNPTISGRLQ